MGSRRAHLAALLFLGLAGLACGGPAVCSDVPFSAAAERDYAALRDTSAEPWVPPCAFQRDSSVARVFLDTVPGAEPHARMNFVVTRAGAPAFTLSETVAEVPFTQIPQGTHLVRIQTGSAIAEGFAGPSGNGPDIAYLRWRKDLFTFELSATLGARQTESAVLQLVRGLMDDPD